MRLRLITAGLVATVALTTALTLAQTSCGQTPTNVPVRTFERAGRMDVLCLQVLGTDDAGNANTIPAIPVSLDHCAPVATGVDPTTLTFHTIAVVTQTLRGELAVVDLTLGKVIDTSRALPGINFLPVGQNPTDVVVTPDAQMVFVAAAETNKPAIYGIPSANLLGDSENLDEPSQASQQVSLPTWPACALPQAPGRMVIVPTGAVSGEGGVTQGFEIVVVMPGNGTDEAALVGLIDTAAFTDGTIGAGSLAPCPIKSVIHLAENKSALPTTWQPGPAWPLGLPYHDGGIDLFTSTADAGGVQASSNYQLPIWSCPALAHNAGGAADVADASTLALPPGGHVHAAGLATDGRYVWVADQTMPFIHVLDTVTPGTLTEIAPLLATSIVDPTRVITTSELAVSPVTRDYKRYLYAVDARQGSLMIYDITDPANGPRLPLTRPNRELDPLQIPDRILLSSPVATIAFARHDFPLPNQGGPSQTGLLCNPNPNAGDVSQCSGTGTLTDPGVCYRANGTISVPLGPKRLRGVFAFATMTSGQIVAIDVDDWDAPCRRPVYLDGSRGLLGALGLQEPAAATAGDLDPYHVPVAVPASDGGAILSDSGVNQWVTDEAFWPVIQPHRIRSAQVEEDDLTGTNGLHAPALTTAPTLLINTAPVSLAGQPYALLTAAMPEFHTSVLASPQATPPNVFMAHDVPDVHVDQTWNIVYEGALPNFNGVVATISSDDSFATMTLSSPTAFFCGHGVEDHRLGLQRFAAMQVDDAVMTKPQGATTFIPTFFDQRVGDYVQLTDDILGAADAGPGIPIDDPFWTENATCWAGISSGGAKLDTDDSQHTVALARQQLCIDKFGASGSSQNPQRDFPILEATESAVRLGRYAYLDQTNRPTNGRVIAPRDTTPQVNFQLTQCCFHNQAHFQVRTGGEWVALGQGNFYLHHIVADSTNACVQSCDPQTVLLNSRAPELAVPALPAALTTPPTRNSPFAMRNPAFSYFFTAPPVTGPSATSTFSVSIRDDVWQFSTRGQYNQQGISLTSATTAVLPQSSMFVPPLGALAVVDGSAEGLFLIDLNTLSIAGGSPFF